MSLDIKLKNCLNKSRHTVPLLNFTIQTIYLKLLLSGFSFFFLMHVFQILMREQNRFVMALMIFPFSLQGNPHIIWLAHTKRLSCGCLAAGWVGSFPPSCSQQPRALTRRLEIILIKNNKKKRQMSGVFSAQPFCVCVSMQTKHAN